MRGEVVRPASPQARGYAAVGTRTTQTRVMLRPPRPLAAIGGGVVGMAGFEPTTFRSQSGRATNLRHIP